MLRAVVHTMRAGAVSVIAALPLAGKGIAADASVNEVAQGNRTFALQLYRKLSTTEGNLFFSPYSISTALAMTYGGAREATASQMATTLHFTLDQETLHPGFAALEAKLNAIGQKGEVRMHVANSIWPSARHELLPPYLDLVREHYGASVTPLDYIREPEKARRTINGWVEAKTEEKIKDLIPPGVVGPSTAMVLANAIYFKGNWTRQFDEKATHDAPFYLSADQPVEVPMMRQESAFRYLKRGEIELLELPYAGDDLSMLLLLPELGGLPALEESLTSSWLDDGIRLMMVSNLVVIIPQFRMTQEFELAPVLSAMGMRDAFVAERADFSGMNGGKPPLFISNVIHKAFVEVNEEGTEATAATGVGMKMTSIALPPQFNANRPFLFLIRENEGGSILFMGRVADPTARGE